MFLDRPHLRLLIDLGSCGSLSLAAQMQNITQSAASQRLREAERRLGIALTRKQGRSLILTSAAQHLVEKARHAERMLSDAESEARWIARFSGKRLRLVLTVFDRFDFLSGVTEKLGERDISLTVLRRMPEQAGAMLTDGLADFLITPQPLAPPGHPGIALFRDRLVAICPPDHPLARLEQVSPEAVMHERYLTYNDQPGVGFEYEQFFHPAGIMPDRVERIESVGMIIDMIAHGRGVSILPACAARAETEAGRVRARPLSVQTRLDWWIAYRQGLTREHAPEDLARIFSEAMRGERLTDRNGAEMVGPEGFEPPTTPL